MKYLVTDPDHEWYGKEIEILSNPGRGAMSAYVCRLKRGTKEERQYEKILSSDQWERVEDLEECGCGVNILCKYHSDARWELNRD